MTDLSPQLARLGHELEQAAGADLAPARRPRRGSRRLALAVGLAVVTVPGAAFATHALIDADDVARSLPAGTLVLAGTSPSCTVVEENVEYRCMLERPPAVERLQPGPEVTVVERSGKRSYKLRPRGDTARRAAPATTDWKGAAQPTVDATRHVNGGCRSLASDGRTWQCYIGQAAVEQRIIGPGMLGAYAPTPTIG